ncbi:MAG: PDZ domain-containing protein [Gemmatales bacterium]|nr:PDZ domain-containing protein [Gemmatales bacterium]
MARLAEQFVCVRIQAMNGVNINVFRFDYDLTWMAFFMNADEYIYARYGGREDHDAESHLNKESLLRTMKEVLELHRQGGVRQPDDKAAPAKRVPEDLPVMREIIPRRPQGCIHCHDVKGAELIQARREKRLRKEMVFIYPPPSTLGVELDAVDQRLIRRVLARSPAERAGLRAGDAVLVVNGQAVLTFGDITHQLSLVPDPGQVKLTIQREKKTIEIVLTLPAGWKRSRDPSWRETLHLVGPGAGFWGSTLSPQQKRQLGLAENALAISVQAVYGPHAQQAGIRNGDVVIELDGLREDMTIRQLHAHLHLNRQWGDTVTVTVLRQHQRIPLRLPLPASPPPVE